MGKYLLTSTDSSYSELKKTSGSANKRLNRSRKSADIDEDVPQPFPFAPTEYIASWRYFISSGDLVLFTRPFLNIIEEVRKGFLQHSHLIVCQPIADAVIGDQHSVDPRPY